MPRSIEVVQQVARAITLTWDAPLDLGGRDDVSYRVCYQEDGVAEKESCIKVIHTTAVISG
jgi:hypothetical protein